jgi:hypothetical protein
MDKRLLSFISSSSVICIDLYRNFMGSMLVLFVPAQCGNHPCNPIENLMQGGTLYLVGVGLNLLTFISLFVLEVIEFRRENWLNKYLIVNPHLPADSEGFALRLGHLTKDRQRRLINIVRLFQRWVYFTFFIYLSNIAVSSYIIFTLYFDNKTPVSLFTHTLLIGGKLYDVYFLVFSGDHVFFSAYKRQHALYTDVNPAKMADRVFVIREA